MKIQGHHIVIGIVCLFSGCGALGVAGLVTIGYLCESQIIPDTACLQGREVRAEDVAWLKKEGIVPADETLQWFYSDGVFSISEDGNLFTDESIVSYSQDIGARLLDQVRFEDVGDVYAEWGESFLAYTIVTVEKEDGTWFQLILSTESGRDRLFVEDLLTLWEAAG